MARLPAVSLLLLAFPVAAAAGELADVFAPDPVPATACAWVEGADAAPELVCYDDAGFSSERFTIQCGDGTTISFLGAGPGNGCASAQAINECRGHRGCVAVF
jgi:hypothetical protein